MVIVFYFFHFVPLKFGSANTHAWSKMFELVIQTYANKMNHIHEWFGPLGESIIILWVLFFLNLFPLSPFYYRWVEWPVRNHGWWRYLAKIETNQLRKAPCGFQLSFPMNCCTGWGKTSGSTFTQVWSRSFGKGGNNLDHSTLLLLLPSTTPLGSRVTMPNTHLVGRKLFVSPWTWYFWTGWRLSPTILQLVPLMIMHSIFPLFALDHTRWTWWFFIWPPKFWYD